MLAMQRITVIAVYLCLLGVLVATPVLVHSTSVRRQGVGNASTPAIEAEASPAPAEDADADADAESEGPPIITIPSPVQHTGNVTACAGYRLTSSSVLDGDVGLDGVLELIGNCSAYGPDYSRLKLSVRYETAERLRVRIVDADGKAHVVPDDVAPWPAADAVGVDNRTSALKLDWTAEPFTFKVSRKSDGTVLFDTTNQTIIFEEQFVRVTSALREGSNIQGLGQHNDNFSCVSSRPHADTQPPDRPPGLCPHAMDARRIRRAHIHQPLRRTPHLCQPKSRRPARRARRLPAQLERHGHSVPASGQVHRVQRAGRRVGL
jgi:hypothetical protein